MTLADMLCALRKRLIAALDADDRTTCSDMMGMFTFMIEASYDYPNRELTGLLEILNYCAQHGAMGVQWKARGELPSEEKIKSTCN
jgi:hypothetical protein